MLRLPSGERDAQGYQPCGVPAKSSSTGRLRWATVRSSTTFSRAAAVSASTPITSVVTENQGARSPDVEAWQPAPGEHPPDPLPRDGFAPGSRASRP